MPGVGSPTGLRAQGVVTAAFQPIFDLRDGAVIGYEALARPLDGTSPEELFSTARAEGRLTQVDRACRAEALRAAAEAGLGAPFALFLNADAGALELDLPDLPMGGATLVMEITETALTERPEAVLRTLTELRTRGWGVSLDDVGADSRSLAVMPLLYPDVIKLDLRLLAERDPIDLARIVTAVGAEAERRHATVLAEGIDSDAQLEMARAAGATLGQGFMLGEPAPLPDPLPTPGRPLRLGGSGGDPSGPVPFQRVTNWKRPTRGPLVLAERAAALMSGQASALGQQNARLTWAFWGAGALLLVWSAAVFAIGRRGHRALTLKVVLRKPHYIQACVHTTLLLYWGWYWRPVYDFAPFIAAQLIFAFAVDMLLAWSRRDEYALGFGPFPIVFSISLFLWFKADWFYLQFLMILTGLCAKDLIRWKKNGHQAHIFNPSSFPLAIASIILIATGTTHITWGEEIAFTQILPPHMYLLIFGLTLPAQFLFGVGTMTMSAAITMYGFCFVYLAVTGTEFFVGPCIPIAVFLSMHLLFTDPATSPQTPPGRIVFGILYGASVLALFSILERAGAPTFYDKLLAVPILNLMIQWLDRVARWPAWRILERPRGNLAVMALWAVVFALTQLVTGAQLTEARGAVLLAQGRFDEAAVRFGELLQTGSSPSDPIAELRRSLGMQPEDGDVSRNLGYALLQAGRFQDATGPLRRAAERQPNDPAIRTNLGTALAEQGDFEGARLQFDRALALDPGSTGALENLAGSLMALARPGEAVPYLRRLIALEPANERAHLQLGRALLSTRQFPEAASEFRSALSLNQGSTDALNNLGIVQMAQGQLDDAIALFERALILKPDLTEAQNNLAVARARQRQAPPR